MTEADVLIASIRACVGQIKKANSAQSPSSWGTIEVAADKLSNAAETFQRRLTGDAAQSSQVSTLAKLADKWRVQAKQYDEAAKECYYRGDDDEGDMNDIEGSALFRCATELDTALKSLAAQPPASPVEDRKTFTIPPGSEAVRDSEGRATGEVRPTTAPRSELRFSEQSWSHEEREIRAPAAPVETEEYPLYSASIAWSDEDNAYIGTIRELPGCCADGATPEECIRELKDAKAAWIEACKAAGKPVPAPAKFQPSHLPCSAETAKVTKTVYVKRWRTLVELPAKYADEIVDALRPPANADLTKMLDLHVDSVRHYLHLQIGKPLSKDLISAPEIALDNLHREVKAAILSRAEPQTSAVQSERDRCVAICEGWMERFEGMEIQYTSAREYACDAINDVMDLIRDGVDPSSPMTRPKLGGGDNG